MTFGKKQDGSGVLELSKKEMADMLARKPVIKESGDSQGDFVITVKLTRKRRRREGNAASGLPVSNG
jgi:hypothetical protein